MTLLAPWALWFAAVGAAVVALYVLKIKRRQQVVPALDFWRELAGRTKVHSLFERLKRLLSMLLWLVIAACLVLALGNPILSFGRIKPRAIAIVIDNSASMQTLEKGGDEDSRTRFELAREAIAELTSRRPVNDEWLLIEAAREPRVLEPWTYDAKAVREAAASLQPFGGSGDLAAAVELASQLLAGKSDPCIVVVSDGGAGEIVELAQDDSRIIHWPIGEARDNLGITRLAVRRHPQHANHHVLVAIVNAGEERIETQLNLMLDGVTHSVELLDIGPGATWEKTIVIDALSGGGGVLRAVIDREDVLALDNEAFAPLAPAEPTVVWLVSPPERAFFFEQALASMSPLVWAEESLTMSLAQYEEAMRALDGERIATLPVREPDLVVFNGVAPEALPASGRFIFINTWPGALPAQVRGEIDSPELFPAPSPHPVTEHISLHGVRLAKAREVILTGRATVLAHTGSDDPLLFLIDEPNRQSLCLAFDVMDSDMPFRNAFPLLLRNAVAHMHAEAPSWLRGEYEIGEPIHPARPLPGNVAEASLTLVRADDVRERAIRIEAGRFVLPGADGPGALRLAFGEEASHAAINLADARETRLAPVPAPADPAELLGLSDRLFGAMPWIGFALAAAALITLEWLTSSMRWTE